MAHSIPQRWRIGSLVLLALACLSFVLPSCGNGRKKVYPVHGQVFAKNQEPAAGAFVIFHPVNADDSDPNKPSAYVEDDGSFRLTTYKEGDGAPAGEYVVTIEWKPRIKSAFDPNRHGKDRLDGRYSNVANSRIRFTIERKKDKELPPIHLN